jgi:deoxyguanosine kinase
LIKEYQVVICYIGLGSNLGDKAKYINTAKEKIESIEGITLLQTSSVIESPPLGGAEGENYLNAVAKIETKLDCRHLYQELSGIEQKLGRKRQIKWASRTIDLDILLYGDEIIQTEKLKIPHQQMHLRSFVMTGMRELDPERVHPILKRTMSELATRLNGCDFTIQPDKPQVISVAGVIGVGKTTLAKALAKELGCEMVPEAYDSNPYLADVYNGRKELALKSQLYFLESRVAQLDSESLERGKIIVTDYVFDKEFIFAKLSLSQQQAEEYNRRHNELRDKVAEPVVVIYLQDAPKACLERINQRNRPYEKGIDLESLISLSADYEAMFAQWKICPVIRIDTGQFDCRNIGHVEELAKEIESYIWKPPKP